MNLYENFLKVCMFHLHRFFGSLGYLSQIFLDEVRALGRLLSIPAQLVGRHPFPGPGLAIRILGPVTREQVKILQQADHIYIEEIRKAGLYDQIAQAFAVLLPVKAVGVMGDMRTYEQVGTSSFIMQSRPDIPFLSTVRSSLSAPCNPKTS